jgi:uncharacterized membrane protein
MRIPWDDNSAESFNLSVTRERQDDSSMNRFSDHLANHWLAVAILVVIGGLFAWRRYRSLLLAAPFPLGGLAITGISLDLIGPLAPALVYASLAAGFALIVILLLGRVWSASLALLTFAVGLFGLGGWYEASLGTQLLELGRQTRSVQFTRPWWLLLLSLVPVVLYLARNSLAGLGTARRVIAVGTRCIIVSLLACALAEPRVNRQSENVTTIFLLDRSQSVPQDIDANENVVDQVDRRWQRVRLFVRDSVLNRGIEHNRDKAGVILFGKRPKLALPPASVRDKFEVDDRMAGPIDGQYTDIAAALKLAIASFPEGTGKRVVLVSDGNQNIGNALEQAAIAKQNGVEIDTIAVAPDHKNESEVLVQAVEAPPITTTGTRLPLRVLIRNTSKTRLVRGVLELIRIGLNPDGSERMEQVAIENDQPQVLDAPMGKPTTVVLQPGLNSLRFRDVPPKAGETSFSYRATFTPVLSGTPTPAGQLADIVMGMPNDRVANNRATTAVVMKGQRRVLFVEEPKNGKSEHAHLIRTLLNADVKVSVVSPGRIPAEPTDFSLFLTNYDCIVLANVPAEQFSRDQMEALRSSVHDQGTGLIMIGGPDSFGPGGYQNTPVEEALPVHCEIKSPMAAGKGGLILIMHASEMADGNHWQKVIAKLAIERLSAPDMVGVCQYGFGVGAAGVSWVIPFQTVGQDKGRLLAKIDRMDPQDMPDFDPFLKQAADILANPDHNLSVKHCIVISDGDPQYGANGKAATAKMAENAITCTTVGVATHGGAQSATMKSIAEATKDGKGNPGSYYEPKDPKDLPAIYIKESRRISQSFIYDKPFLPQHRIVGGGITEGIPTQLPPLRGFVRTTFKESPLAQFRIEGPAISDELRFPVLASWQYGLGKAVAFTSDARTQPATGTKGWDADWVESDLYKKFWEQAVTWALRPAESGRMTVVSEFREGRVRVTVNARDERDRPVSNLDLQGKIGLPRTPKAGEKIPTLEFKKRGPGQYEAEFAADDAGTYFVTVQGYQPGVGKQAGAIFDTARTGVTLPYSQEFADLDTNTSLLKQLSRETGGRYHTDDATELEQLAKFSELFREAPKTSRSYQTFWPWLVFAAGALMLLDVGIRRIAVEGHEVSAFANKFWAKLREKPELETASGALGQLQRRKLEIDEKIERERAARRFDPSAPTSEPAPRGADEIVADSPKSSLPVAPPPRAEDKKRSAEADDMFSRLKKARDRADHKKDKKDDE